VVVVDNTIIPLDIPLHVSLRTVEVGAGWRVPIRTKPKPPARPAPPGAKPAPPGAKPAPPARPGAKLAPPRFAVYGGAGFLNVSYKEESDFASPTDNNRASFGGYSVFGGFDVLIVKWVFAGVEGQYRGVANAIGESGVSKVYGETDLGGAAFRVLVGSGNRAKGKGQRAKGKGQRAKGPSKRSLAPSESLRPWPLPSALCPLPLPFAL
jgi:hypothetical protein